MLSLFQTLTLRYLTRYRFRALLIILSIALGVATWAATDALNSTLSKSIREAATPLGGNADLYVSNSVTVFIPSSLGDQIKTLPAVEEVKPLIKEDVEVALPSSDSPGKPPEMGEKPGEAEVARAVLLGIELPSSPRASRQLSSWDIDVVDLDLLAFAEALRQGQTPVLVGQKLDEEFLKGKRTFTLVVHQKTYTLLRVGQIRARGQAATLGSNVLVMDWQHAARLLEKEGHVHRFDVKLKEGVDKKQALADVRAEVADRAEVQTPESQEERIQDILKGLEIGFKLCGAGALVVGLLLVYNALSVSVAERRHDIGILRSVGATRMQVRVLFVAEALVLGVIGTILGIPLGLGLAHLCLGPMQSVLKDVISLPFGGPSEVGTSPRLIVTAVLGGLATAFLAALIPASQAAAEEPADAVRRAPPSTGFAYRLVQVTCSVMLILVGVCIIAFKPLLPVAMQAIYVGLLMVLLGALLATPLLAALLTRSIRTLTQSWLPIESRLASDNLVRSPGRTGLVIAALASGVALMVQTSGVIRSNEEAILGWIDDTVRADLFLSSGGPISSTGQLKPIRDTEIEKDLKAELPLGTRLVGKCYRYPDWDPQTALVENGHKPGFRKRLSQGPTKIFLTLLDAKVYYEANKDRVTSAEERRRLELYAELGSERGKAIVSENFALMHGVKTGDTIRLKGTKGPVLFTVIGTVVDYAWNRGALILDRQHNREVLAADKVHAWEVYLPSGTDVEEVRLNLLQQSEVGTKYALFALTKGEVRDQIQSMIRRLYSMAYTQELVVGIVAVLGVVTSLLISVLGRRRELGLLRAVGGTRWQLLHTVLAEAVLIGLVGTVIGVLIGLPMEWYVVRVILFEEAGYLFPVSIPWIEAAVIAALAMFSATLAGLGPAIGAMRMRIADAIAYE